MSATVEAVATCVQRAFPAEWAEPWDAVGLLVGSAGAHVAGVLVTLDPTPSALTRAMEVGANLLVTHHPAFIEPPARFTDRSGIAFAAAQAGVALVAAHTNLDRSPAGGDALAVALGLPIVGALEDGAQPCDAITTYVPASAAGAVRAAAASAGAGRIGNYADCSFSVEGTGRFTPLPGAHPAQGTEGLPAEAEELRIDMVAPVGMGPRVAAAIRAAHPYDEPLVVMQSASIMRGAARLGRLCDADGRTGIELASGATKAMPCVPRVLGDADRRLRLVAAAGGSGGGLVPSTLAVGADALITGELRYHDALEAVGAGLVVIELGHDASEWPMVPVLAEAVRATPGLSPDIVVVEPADTIYHVS